MANKRSLWRRWFARLAVLTVVLILPRAASGFSPTEKDRLLIDYTAAQQAEDRHDWKTAYDIYLDVLGRDRNQVQARERLPFVLRNLHRRYRLNDASFRYQLTTLKWPKEALEFYKDVLLKVQDSYPNVAKKDLNRLHREGLVELRLALEDKQFRDAHLNPMLVGPMQLAQFLNYLRERERDTPNLTTRDQAADEVRKVARKAAKELRLNVRVAVAEMACGACNALDEYSFYLTQGYLGMTGREDKSVVEAKIRETGIGYIRLDRFVEGSTIAELDAAISQLNAQGMKALVLDLRFNDGGSLREAVYVAARFIPSPKLIAATSGKVNDEHRSHATMGVHDMPLLVLIEGSTASAAELLAAALKAHKRAELIGQTTFGKSLIQKTILLTQAPYGAIRITWAQFYVPHPLDPSKLQDLGKVGGVSPTVRVGAGAMGDPQMDAAVERARLAVSMLSMR